MKKIKKTLFAVIGIVILAVVVTMGVQLFNNLNNTRTSTETSTLIKKFESTSKLQVTEITSVQTYTTKDTKAFTENWPDIAKNTFATIVAGREMTFQGDVTTDVKLNLKQLTASDISLKDGVFTVTKPIETELTSNLDGASVKIISSWRAMLDIIADWLTTGSQAWAIENASKMEDATSDAIIEGEILKTSDQVDIDAKARILTDANKALSDFLSNALGKSVTAKLTMNDLEFVGESATE
jgi:signal transduction histidine kinase